MIFRQSIENIKFLSNKIKLLLFFDVLIGVMWFAGETSFLLIIQGFLSSLGIMQDQVSILPSWYPKTVNYNLVCLILFGATRALLSISKQYLSMHTAQVFMSEARKELISASFRKKHKLSMSDQLSFFGEIVGIAGNYVTSLNQFAYGFIASILFFLVTLKVAPVETSIGTVLLVIFLYPLKKITGSVSGLGERLNANSRAMYETLITGIKNLFFLRLYRMTDSEALRGIDQISEYEKSSKVYALSSSFSSGIPQFIGLIVLVVATWLGINFSETKPLITVAFFYLFIRFSQTASGLFSTLTQLKVTSSSFVLLRETILKLRTLDSAIEQNVQNEECDEIKIEMRDVSCRYDQGNVFENISFVSTRGKFILLKGPSGSGKSTLLKTLLGIHKPNSGIVLLNDRKLEYGESLAKKIGYVGPEPFLIQATVRENLLYGNSNSFIKDDELWMALRCVDLEKKIFSLTEGLNSILLEETQLSTGQKQRLSFARALLRKPKLLILDEATANIDEETEKSILNVLRLMKKDISAIIVSHKNTFDELADETIILGGKHGA